MMVSTKGRYALRVLIDLAVNSQGSYVSLKGVAERQEVSMKYLEKKITEGHARVLLSLPTPQAQMIR